MMLHYLNFTDSKTHAQKHSPKVYSDQLPFLETKAQGTRHVVNVALKLAQQDVHQAASISSTAVADTADNL